MLRICTAWLVLTIASLVAPSPARADNGPGLAYFEKAGAQIPALPMLDPASPDAKVDAATFDPSGAEQAAERQMLWVRNLLARRASDQDVRAALDRIGAWQAQVHHLLFQSQNEAAVEAAAKAAPTDFQALRRRAAFWVDAVDGEREAMFDMTDPRARLVLGDQVRLNVQTGAWEYPVMFVRKPEYRDPPKLSKASQAFPHARDAVQALLAVAPNNAEALYRYVELYRYSTQSVQDAANHGAALSGPYGAALRAYVLTTDSRVGQMQARASQLRFGGTQFRNVISTGIGTSVPKGQLMSIPVHIPPTPQALAEANRLQAAADQLAAEQKQQLEATVATAPMSEPMFVILAGYTTGLPNDVVRDRILRNTLMLDPGDWRIYEIYAELASGHSDMKTIERAADGAQRELLWHRFEHPLALVQAQSKLGFDFYTYELARRAVRHNPVGCPENAALAGAMEPIAYDTFDGAPVIPDGAKQTLLQWVLTEQVCKRELDHPDEWAGWSRDKLNGQIQGAEKAVASIEAQTKLRP